MTISLVSLLGVWISRHLSHTSIRSEMRKLSSFVFCCKYLYIVVLLWVGNVSAGEDLCRFDFIPKLRNRGSSFVYYYDVSSINRCAQLCFNNRFCLSAVWQKFSGNGNIKSKCSLTHSFVNCSLHGSSDDPPRQYLELQKATIFCISCVKRRLHGGSSVTLRPQTTTGFVPQPPQISTTARPVRIHKFSGTNAKELVGIGQNLLIDGKKEVQSNLALYVANLFALNFAQRQCGDPEYYWSCTDGIGCIFKHQLLDGIQDCPNGSDEDYGGIDECKLGIAQCYDPYKCVDLPGERYKCIFVTDRFI